jgi:preprotein translocase subunit SecG
MTTVLLIIHLFVTLALIGVVLIQRSEGGGLGIGTAQGMGAFMSGRGTANLLTRTTAILGAAFFALSLALALMNRGTAGVGRSILDIPPPPASTAPAPAPAAPAPGAPAGTEPSAPAPAAAPGAPAAPSPPSPAAQAPAAQAPAAPAPATPAPAAPTQGGPAVPNN